MVGKGKSLKHQVCVRLGSKLRSKVNWCDAQSLLSVLLDSQRLIVLSWNRSVVGSFSREKNVFYSSSLRSRGQLVLPDGRWWVLAVGFHKRCQEGLLPAQHTAIAFEVLGRGRSFLEMGDMVFELIKQCVWHHES